MSDGTHIEWTDATWNPITGCSIVSPGCANCYAMKLAGTRLKHIPSRAGLTVDTKAGPVWNGQVRFNEDQLCWPLKWQRARKIFVCAHGDLFAEGVPDEWIDRVFAVMALSPQHIFQVLTKRPERMQDYLADQAADRRIHELACDMSVEGRLRVVLIADREHEASAPPGLRVYLDLWPLSNVWLGTSVEDQKRADERIPVLLETPAAVRFISAEPLLGPMDITPFVGQVHHHPDNRPSAELDAMIRAAFKGMGAIRLDWVIVGGESGPGARPMHPDWARSLCDQCAGAGVAFFFKQWGAWSVNDYDRDHDDPDWRQCDVVVRETPDGQWLNLAGGQGFHGDRVVRAVPVGKKAAGRLLDGIEHNGMPAVSA